MALQADLAHPLEDDRTGRPLPAKFKPRKSKKTIDLHPVNRCMTSSLMPTNLALIPQKFDIAVAMRRSKFYDLTLTREQTGVVVFSACSNRRTQRDTSFIEAPRSRNTYPKIVSLYFHKDRGISGVARGILATTTCCAGRSEGVAVVRFLHLGDL